jgi:type IV pilus assembly protein PilW
MRLHRHHPEQGFTLIELLIALAISGVVLSAMANTFIGQRKTYALQEQVTEMTQNARSVMEMLTREIRMAGYNPQGIVFDAITYNPAQLQIRADLNKDGDTADLGETIIYSHDDTNKQLLRNAGAGNQVLADRIDDFTFDYLDSAGTSTTITANIRQVQLVIIAKTAKPDPTYAANGGYRTYTLTSRITPRN